MFNKGFSGLVAAIVAAVIIIAAGAGFLLWQQTKLPAVPAGEGTPPPVPSGVEGPAPEVVATTTGADTANWKTYRNEEYGFEFKYPAESFSGLPKVNATSPGKEEEVENVRLSPGPNLHPDRTEFFISINRSMMPQELGQYLTPHQAEGPPSEFCLKNVILPSGIPTIEIVSPTEYVSKGISKGSIKTSITTFISKPPYTFIIFTDGYSVEETTLLRQILSTFKFIR